MNSFKVAASKYEESKAILNSMEKIKSDDSSELLIPITSSLYVPGINFKKYTFYFYFPKDIYKIVKVLL